MCYSNLHIEIGKLNHEEIIRYREFKSRFNSFVRFLRRNNLTKRYVEVLNNKYGHVNSLKNIIHDNLKLLPSQYICHIIEICNENEKTFWIDFNLKWIELLK